MELRTRLGFSCVELEYLRREKARVQLEVAERAVLGNPTNAEAQLLLGKALMNFSSLK